jgi:hypothetical protein
MKKRIIAGAGLLSVILMAGEVQKSFAAEDTPDRQILALATVLRNANPRGWRSPVVQAAQTITILMKYESLNTPINQKTVLDAISALQFPSRMPVALGKWTGVPYGSVMRLVVEMRPKSDEIVKLKESLIARGWGSPPAAFWLSRWQLARPSECEHVLMRSENGRTEFGRVPDALFHGPLTRVVTLFPVLG